MTHPLHPGKRTIPLLLALLGAGAFACVLAPIDYTGKTCPCPAPWRCASGVCVAAGAGGSGSSGSGACSPLIVPTDFRVDWTTPATIRWGWDSAGTVDQFGAYRLVLGPSQASVESESGATIFTATQNPELGELNLIHTGQVNAVVATITDGLQPATTYFGKLVAVDNTGCEFATDVLSATTSVAPSGDIALFVDTIPTGGFPIPASIVVDPSCASGAPCLSYVNDCMGMSLCYENVRLDFTMAGSDIQAQLTAGDFENLAYLEMSVATDSNVASYWSDFRLETDGFYEIDGLTVRAGGAFRTYQIPLRVLMLTGALTYQDLTTAGLREFGVGGTWSDMSHVQIAGVYLRW